MEAHEVPKETHFHHEKLCAHYSGIGKLFAG